MKKSILLLLAVLVIAPVTFGYGFLNITDAQLTKLDASTYRLRISYDWGGDLLPGQVTPTDFYGFPTPTLESFNLSGGGTQSNIFNQAAGISRVRVSPTTMAIRSTGNQFGYDFSSSDPLVTSFTFLDQAHISWYKSDQVNPSGDFLPSLYCFSEDYNGQFTLPTDPSAVPEPASVFLLGLGLIGAAFVKRRK